MTDDEVKDNVSYQDEAAALSQIIAVLQNVTPDTRNRLIQTVITFFDLNSPINLTSRHSSFERSASSAVDSGATTKFSDDRTMSPKEFLLEKQPRTDVERVACLAYYLTHYRDTPHFKTIDISKLNTEAAQRKFANTAKAVSNASRNEYLVPSTKGNRQLGAVGEVFVEALPDRDNAKSAVNNIRPTRKRIVRKPKSA